MQPNRFIRLFLLLFASSAGMYFFSCQRDAEQPTTKPFTDSQVVFRDCDIPGACHCTITTDANATLDLCGDLPQSMTSCSGCNSNNNDTGAAGAEFEANEPKVVCLDDPGSLCIKNVGLSSVDVTVQFGTSLPITIAIGANQTQCFYTEDCESTESHCL